MIDYAKQKVEEISVMAKPVTEKNFTLGCYVLRALRNYKKDNPECKFIDKAIHNHKVAMSEFATEFKIKGGNPILLDTGEGKTVSIKEKDGKVMVY